MLCYMVMNIEASVLETAKLASAMNVVWFFQYNTCCWEFWFDYVWFVTADCIILLCQECIM